jgi:hypothetical protein
MGRFRVTFAENERVLASMVAGLPAPDPGMEAAPKVHSVIGKSYPQFKKAIAAHIVTEFPDDPEHFYRVVTESLKGCVSALKGPGKYLHLLFPDQMKEIRARVATMGNEVNELTGMLAKHREKKEQIEKAEELMREIQRRQDRQEHLGSRHEEQQQKLLLLKERLKELEEEHHRIEGEHGYHLLKSLEDRLKSATESENRAFDEYRARASAAVHTLQRTSKALSKRPGNEHDLHIIEECILAFESLEVAPPEKIRELAGPAGRVVVNALAPCEIVLKNREEREMFSDERGLEDSMVTVSGEYETARLERQRALEDLSGNPLGNRLERINSEIRDIQLQLSREESHARQIGEKQRQFEISGPDARTELEKVLSVLAGKPVSIIQGV